MVRKSNNSGRTFTRVGFGFLGATAILVSSLTTAHASDATLGNEAMSISLSGNESMIRDAKGEEIKAKVVSESSAEKISVAYSELSGASYIRELFRASGTDSEPTQMEDLASHVTEYVESDVPSSTSEFIPASELKVPEATDFELSTTIAASSTSITIAWKLPPEAERAVVLLDGEPIKQAESGAEITKLKPGTTYTLTVAFQSGQGEAATVLREDTHSITTVSADMKDPTRSAESSKAVAAAATYLQAKAVRYLTFINDDYAKAGLLAAGGCSVVGTVTPADWYFSGDNRSWVLPAPASNFWQAASHRTGFQGIALLDGPSTSQGLYVEKNVSPTKRYNSSKVYVDTRTASDSGLTVTNGILVPNVYISFSVNHTIGNPYCLGAIRYTLSNVTIYKSGTITVSGTRHPVPAHEMYGSFTTTGVGTWLTMYRGNQGDFYCTTGLCPTQSISNNVGN